MQITSETYSPYEDVRRSAIRINFKLVDVTAAGDTAPEVSEENRVAQTAQVIREAEGMQAKYGTLEKDHLFLDGSFSFFPDDPPQHHVGWWSAQQSDANGWFSPPPAMTFHFTKKHFSVGFTVIFDDLADQYCTDFSIQTFDGTGAPLTYTEVTGNTLADCPVEMKTDAYHKVVFTFKRTNKPFRYVRVSQILFGIVQRHSNTNTESATLLYEISPAMEAAPANEFVVTIDNADHRYNMVNPNGLYKYLQQGQPLDVEIGTGPRGAMEYVNMGRFYYTRSKASDSSLTAQITADTPFYFMENTTYRRGRIGIMRVRDFIEEIVRDAGFPLVVRAEGDIGERSVSTACDLISHRKAIQLAAQAARCVCIISRENEVVLTEPCIGMPADTLTLDRQTDMPGIDNPDRVNTVELKITRSTPRDGNDEIFNGPVEVNGTVTRWLDYKNPAHDVAVTVHGGKLISAEFYMCAARLTMESAGTPTVVMTGAPYDRNDVTVTAQALEADEIEQVKKIDNPLIAPGQERRVAQWLLQRKHNIYSYDVSERANPAREVTDSVQIFDAYGEHRTALATKIQLKFDGTLSGTMQAQGGLPGK